MKKLKQLRINANLSQEQCADVFKVSQQTIARWESGKSEPNLKALRDIAVYFGTSVDDLMSLERGDTKSVRTNHIAMGGDTENQTFWGHVGLMLPGADKSVWFPVTGRMATFFANKLRNQESGWLVLETLNNRTLVIDPAKFKKISLIDDAEDPIANDWDLTWDGYSGHSPEIYPAIELRLSDEFTQDEFGEQYSESIGEMVDEIIKEHNINDENKGELLTETHFHYTDGSVFSFDGDPEELALLIALSEDQEVSMFTLEEYGSGKEFFFPSKSITMISIPTSHIHIDDDED